MSEEEEDVHFPAGHVIEVINSPYYRTLTYCLSGWSWQVCHWKTAGWGRFRSRLQVSWYRSQSYRTWRPVKLQYSSGCTISRTRPSCMQWKWRRRRKNGRTPNWRWRYGCRTLNTGSSTGSQIAILKLVANERKDSHFTSIVDRGWPTVPFELPKLIDNQARRTRISSS